MTDKVFKALKITSVVLTIGSSLLSAWVGSKEAELTIGKEVLKAVTNTMKGSR